MAAAGAYAASSACSGGPEEPQGPPNIVFLFSDDQRWDALGAAGNPIIHTPNLDRLAAEGVMFTNNFVTTSICAVSRASAFTGLYARTHGIHGFQESLTAEQHALSYPVRLREAGYRTGFVGKYGVGRTLPAERFDYFQGFAGQGHYFQETEEGRRHLTGLMGEQALEFLDGCTDEQPFCLSVSFKAPHVQDREAPYFLSDPAYDELYKDVEIPVPPKADPKYYEALPDFLKGGYEGRVRWERRFGTPEKYQESVKRYYRLITGIDDQVGRIRTALEERGWDRNTVVIFTSDNGFFLGERGLAGKWLMHEESIRTPLIIHDPRAPERHGTRPTPMTLNIDVAPTILRLAGLDPAPGIQGRDLSPLLAGDTPEWREDWFYEHLFEHDTIPKTEGVRNDRWKYFRYLDTDPVHEELYDLESDPQELDNLAGAERAREQLQQMRERLELWRTRLENSSPGEPWEDPA